MIHHDAFEPKFLTHLARLAPCACADGELDRAKRFAGLDLVPQQFALGQSAVVLRAHQQIDGPPQGLGALHQRKDVAFAITDLHQPGISQFDSALQRVLSQIPPRWPLESRGSRAHIQASSTPKGSRSVLTA